MIQVVNRALNILEIIAKNPEKEVGLSEIADSLGLNHGTCANILKTLVNRDYVEQTAAKKGYKLGYMAYRLTNANYYNVELLNVSKASMEDLANEINEMVILSAIKNDKRILLKEIPCNHEVQVKTAQESSVYRATTGRMILAFYSPKELDDFVQRIGLPSEEDWPEVKTKTDLIHLLDEIRTKKFEITCNKNHVIGLATPLFKKDTVIASLGIYLPDLRFGKTEKSRIVKALQIATDTINEELERRHL